MQMEILLRALWGGLGMDKILFHYCNVEAFFSIIKDSKIWLSDVGKSNDYQECILCRNLVNEGIESILSENEEDLQAWRQGYSWGKYTSHSMGTFCTCFSESRDQLSQWRGYANDGRGIAIGFNKELLLRLNSISEHHTKFGKVIYYNHEKQRQYINSIIKDNIEKLDYKGIGHAALELNINYRLKFPFIKNAGFVEEKEWRVVVCSEIDNYHNIPSSDDFVFSKIKYRVANEKLIPYLEMDFERIKRELVKEIWIGPKSEVEIEDIVNFLKMCGYYDGVEYNSDEPISIRKSESSYR